eukprot:Opistho-2@69424
MASREGSASSALGRLRITETIDDGRVNPDPLGDEDEFELEPENFLDNYISASKLKMMTGIDDLTKVTFLEMRVDTTENSLGDFGALLPTLVQLKLSNSIIASVRDLGTSLSHLKVLWMARCGLMELDGISSLGSLRELYLAFNLISELSPLTMLDELEVLDIEGNNVDDISQVEFLALCPSLTSLTIDSNPLTSSPKPAGVPPSPSYSPGAPYDYQAVVCKLLPRLQFLDDEPVNGHERPPQQHQHANNAGPRSAFSQKASPKQPAARPGSSMGDTPLDRFIVAEGIKNTVSLDVAGVDGIDPLTGLPSRSKTPTRGRPGSSMGVRPGTSLGGRPGTSLGGRPGTSLGGRPGTSLGGRPGTSLGGRPGTSMGRVTAFGRDEGDGDDDSDDGSSNLTHGVDGVLCGNPVMALRARRARAASEEPDEPPSNATDALHPTPQQGATSAPGKAHSSNARVTSAVRKMDLDASTGSARGFDMRDSSMSPSALSGSVRAERLDDIFEELRAWREQFRDYKPTDLESPSDDDDGDDGDGGDSDDDAGRARFEARLAEAAAASSSSAGTGTGAPSMGMRSPPSPTLVARSPAGAGFLQKRNSLTQAQEPPSTPPHVVLGSSPTSQGMGTNLLGMRPLGSIPVSNGTGHVMQVSPTPPSLSRPRTAPSNNVRRRIHMRATEDYTLPGGSESLGNSPLQRPPQSNRPPEATPQRPLSVPSARPRVLGKIKAPPTPGERDDKRAALRAAGPIVAGSTEGHRIVRFDNPRPVTAFGSAADYEEY